MGKLGWGPGGWRRRQLGKVGRMGKLGWAPRGWRRRQLGKVGKMGWGPCRGSAGMGAMSGFWRRESRPIFPILPTFPTLRRGAAAAAGKGR